jgi:hypothetical protein
MKGMENEIFLIAYSISNAFAIIFLISSLKWPRLSRVLYFALFAWASWANWNIALNNPQDYLSYADFTFLPIYKSFIHGWFNDHIQLSVGFIATSQGLIAVLMWMKGWWYRLGIIGGVTFLIAVIPLGIGAAFPCTLLLAIGLGCLRKQDTYLWQPHGGELTIGIQ